MPKPFEALGERLLRAGAAPRHVRAYLSELREHLADIVEQECAAGGDARDALARAHARLGDDETLAQAMLSRRRVRSLTARAPWLVLVLLQPFTMLVVAFAALCSLIVGAMILGAPAMSLPFGQIFALSANLLVTPLVAALFALIAWRQRVSPLWALLGSAFVLLFLPHVDVWSTRPDPLGFPPGVRLQYHWSHSFILGVGLFPPFHVRTWTMIGTQWPWMVVQCVLTLLPPGWLWLRRRSMA
jgi:hypothetical protein